MWYNKSNKWVFVCILIVRIRIANLSGDHRRLSVCAHAQHIKFMRYGVVCMDFNARDTLMALALKHYVVDAWHCYWLISCYHYIFKRSDTLNGLLELILKPYMASCSGRYTRDKNDGVFFVFVLRCTTQNEKEISTQNVIKNCCNKCKDKKKKRYWQRMEFELFNVEKTIQCDDFNRLQPKWVKTRAESRRRKKTQQHRRKFNLAKNYKFSVFIYFNES